MLVARQYSHGKHVASDALRGLAVGIRGVLEAKRMAREAKSGREKRIADHYVRLKRLDLQERRLAITEGTAARAQEKLDLDKQIQETEAAKVEALEELGKTYDEELDAYFDERTHYQAEMDSAEKSRLRASLLRRGAWLESNAGRVGRSFPAHKRFIESDEQRRAQALENQEKEEALQRKKDAIEKSEALTPEQKQKALSYLDINPDYDVLSELEAEAETAEEEKKKAAEVETENRRKAKQQLLDEHKGKIIAGHGEPIWDALKIVVETAADPNEVDVLKYLEPEAAKKKETAPDVIEVTSGIEDESIRQTVTRFTANSDFTDKGKVTWARQIANELVLGNRGVVLRIFSDRIRAMTKTSDKFISVRLPISKQLVNIRQGIFDLKKLGVQTGRVLSHYVEGMSLADWKAALSETAIEFSGLEELNPEQRRKAAEIATQINASLVLILQRVSRTAVHESEFERWRAMLPALFKSEIINIGSIDGFLSVMRNDQQAAYEAWTTPEIASEMLAQEGWGNIKTTEDYRQERQEQQQEMNTRWQAYTPETKNAYAAAAIDTAPDRDTAIRNLVNFFGIREDEAKQSLEAFDNLSSEEQQSARDLAEELKNE